MRRLLLLLGKDAKAVVRSPTVAASLVLYPLVIAALIGLLVRYAGERPRVAYVDTDGLPSVVTIGERSFDIAGMLAGATEVKLVPMQLGEADRELRNGQVLAVVVVPKGFAADLRALRRSPKLVLRTTRGGLSSRVVEKVQALVYSINLSLQRAYIDANLSYIELLRTGGTAKVGSTTYSLLGLERAERELDQLVASRDPAVAAKARGLRAFIRTVISADKQVGDFLRATANPIQLEHDTSGGRTWLLSAQVQAIALAIALAFVATLLGATAITAERDENAVGRLVRGLVGLGALLAEKVAFVALVGGALGMLLAVVLGAIVELGGVAGGEPWVRLPLLAFALLVAAASFAAFGVLMGTLAREGRTAALVAFLVVLPVVLLGFVPSGSSAALAGLADAFPFGHATRLFQSALYDASPAAGVAEGAAILLGLGAAYGLLARLAARRLLA